VYYSFTQWDGQTATWVGVSTWTQAFHNPNLWTALRNNALLLLSVPFALGLPLCIAVLLHQRVAGWRIFRTIYFLPTAISWVVLGLVAERFFAFQGRSIRSSTHSGFHTSVRTCSATNPKRSSRSHHLHLYDDWYEHHAVPYGARDARPESRRGRSHRRRWPVADLSKYHAPHLSRFIQLAFVMTVIALFSALFSLIFVMTGGGPATRPRPWSTSSTKPGSTRVTSEPRPSMVSSCS